MHVCESKKENKNTKYLPETARFIQMSSCMGKWDSLKLLDSA